MTVVRVHGAELFVQDSGGDGPPVVFLHGWLADGRMFDHQAQALGDRFRCIALDFRGAGRSSRPTSGYQVEQHAADVRATLRHLGLDRVHMVGFSLGGMVAMRLAARDPDLVASVTLGNTTARANPGTKVAPYLSVALLIRIVGPSLPGDLDQGLFGTAFRNDPANRQARRTWQQRRSQLDRACAVRTLAGMMIRPDIRAELPDISCPTLVITGSEDAQTPAEHGHEIHDAIPGSRYLELPGVGHCAPIETPTHITEALSDFLTELPVVRTTVTDSSEMAITPRPHVHPNPGPAPPTGSRGGHQGTCSVDEPASRARRSRSVTVPGLEWVSRVCGSGGRC